MLDPLYHAVAWLIVHIHGVLVPVFGKDSDWAWALSIVFLTMFMRLLLFPLFVKQIKTQRAMQVLQPKIKELQVKHKGDREKLNQEMLALYREHNANPLSGCLPLILQIPVFFALFHVLNSIKPKAQGDTFVFPENVQGFPQHLISDAAHAKIFGAPIAAAFNSKPDLMRFLDAHPTSVKVVAVILVCLMGLTTFITQKQLMARNAASGADNPLAAQQKILLYVLPFSFFIFGFQFPLGVLIYWLTTNLWSMAQQAVVIRRMPVPGQPAAATAGAGGGGAAKPPARPLPGKAGRPAATRPGAKPGAKDAAASTPTQPAENTAQDDAPADGAPPPSTNAQKRPNPPQSQRKPAPRRGKKSRRGRR